MTIISEIGEQWLLTPTPSNKHLTSKALGKKQVNKAMQSINKSHNALFSSLLILKKCDISRPSILFSQKRLKISCLK